MIKDIIPEWESAGFTAAHALSLWGYIIDTDFSTSQKERYVAVVLSDSDSDRQYNVDRRTAPNKLHVIWLKSFDSFIDSWKFDDFSNGVFISIETLMPYQKSLPREENPNATKNKVTTPDLVPSELLITDDINAFDASSKLFTTNQDIYINPEVMNLSEANFTTDHLFYNLIIKNSSGDSVLTKTVDAGFYTCSKYMYMPTNQYLNIGKFPVDTYSIEFQVNPEGNDPEAYYYNNTLTLPDAFEVVADPLGEATMTATAGTYGTTIANNSFSYTDPEQFLQQEGNIYSLYESEYNENLGAWSLWRISSDATDEEYAQGQLTYLANLSSCPEKCISLNTGTKMKYMLLIQNGNLKVRLYSNEIALKYKKMAIQISPDSTMGRGEQLTPLSKGATSLKDGEAIQYAKELKETLIDIHSFSGDNKLKVSHSLVIDSEIQITGATEKEDGMLECAEISYNADIEGTTLFIVTPEGNLSLDGVRLTAILRNPMGRLTNPQAFENNGGKIEISRCLISNFQSQLDIPLITLNGGIMNIQQTSFANEEAVSDVIRVNEGATLNLLNCLINFNNTHSHLIHNNGGCLNIVYCSIIPNMIELAENPALIYSKEGADTNIIGSIIHHNNSAEYNDLSSSINAYGVFYGKAAEGIYFDSLSVKGDMADICETRSGSVIGKYSDNNKDNFSFLLNMTEGGAKKVYLKIKDGTLHISKNKKNWSDTKVAPVFDADSYQEDYFGKNHLGFYGGYAPQIVEPDPDPTPDPPPSPDTGDPNHLLFWIILGGISISVLLIALRKHTEK